MMEGQTQHPVMLLSPNGYEHDYRIELEKEIPRRHTLEDALHPENLSLAWKRVRSNKGAAGVDGMKIEEFSHFMQTHRDTIITKLREGTYKPSPVRQCRIPKGNGDYRTLGIPTVLDRVIQQAIAQVLSPLVEPHFSESSHGYRPHRSAQGAMKQFHEMAKQRGKKCTVVDCDLKQFFDTVNHQIMMQKLREHLADEALLGLIHRYLKAGAITPEGNYVSSPEGVPQGGPLSPLLANILLNQLDDELHQRQHDFVRYADDFVILCNSPRAGTRILKSISHYLDKVLKLTVNVNKSRVVALKEASFLGFRILRNRIRWTENAQKKLKYQVKFLTGRSRGVSVQRVYHELRMFLTGYANYYMLGITYAETRELDHWIRRRMRLLYWKQWKRPRTRRRNLLKLGASKDTVKLATRSRKALWRICNVEVVRFAMPNKWLEDQGLVSLSDQWVKARYGAQESKKTT